MIDKSGKHTHWGVWSPIELNTESHWADERGLNSLQILSYLLSAYRMTGNVTFVNAWQMLYNGMYRGVPTEYGRNMINQKVTFPLDDNYSDDELAFLPYFTYFYSLKVTAEFLLNFCFRSTDFLSRLWCIASRNGRHFV